MKKSVVLLNLFFMFAFFLFANNADNDFSKAKIAVESENWEKSIELLKQGIKNYPKDYRFSELLASVYYDKELYKLAYKYFKNAKKNNPTKNQLNINLSDTAANLNLEKDAFDYIIEFLDKEPDNLNAISSYGWLCYKLHDSRLGIKKLEEVIKKNTGHGLLYGTLGTLYSEVYDYNKSKLYYQKAINYGKKHNFDHSTSIYYYNLAILETAFFNFEEAYSKAKDAVSYYDKPATKTMLIELEIMRYNFQKALDITLKALPKDDTPILNLDLITIYLETGHWNEASTIIQKVKNHKNNAWIAHYGLSLLQHKADMFDKERMLYLYKYYEEKRRVKENLLDQLKSIKTSFELYSNYKHCDNVLKVYLTKIADEFKSSFNSKDYDVSYDAYINNFYYEIFKDDSFKALKYLQRAEKVETKFIPKLQASYDAKKGILTKNRALLNSAIKNLDYDWEKAELTEAFVKAISMTKRSEKKLRYLYLQELFNLNPVAFTQNDIQLPVKIEATSTNNKIKTKTLISLFNGTRFTNDNNSPFTLSVIIDDNNIALKLKNQTGHLLSSTMFSYSKITKKELATAYNGFIKKTFTIKLR